MPKKKKIGPDHQLAAHIPFYRTRKFWGVILFLGFLISFFLTFNLIGGSGLLNLINAMIFASGGGTVYFLYATLINNPPYAKLVIALIHIPLLVFFLKRIFLEGTKIKLRFPLALFIMILGAITTVLLLSSL